MDRTLPNVRDASLVKTKALPTGAAAVSTVAFDLGALTGRGIRDYICDLLIEAPLLAVGELANASTMIYSIECDTDAAFGSATTLVAAAITQTGAGGVGAAAAEARFRVPMDCERYLRVTATNSTAADASAKSVTASLLL